MQKNNCNFNLNLILMNKLFLYLNKYRKEIIVGVLVFLFFLFRDLIKSLF
ncbi:MAG: hypothetical protein RIR96_597 [Bacteroidota bacterium]|jgi:hypothetical protein